MLAIISFLAQSGTAQALDADIPHTFQLVPVAPGPPAWSSCKPLWCSGRPEGCSRPWQAEESFLFFDASHDGYIQRVRHLYFSRLCKTACNVDACTHVTTKEL